MECTECFMKFDTPEQLNNHRKKFCQESDWFDPLMMKATLMAEQDIENGDRKALSFDEVRQYLKVRTKGLGDPSVGTLTLDDMRNGFLKNEKDLEILHSDISKQRALEKSEEVRQLKIRQQKMRALKTQEEREVRDLIVELEKRKELELRQRLEKEMVKRELRSLDAVQMKSLEHERKAEIAKLARERGALKHREDDLLAEVKKLEDRMADQELKFRTQQSAVDEYFEKQNLAGRTSTKHEEMQLAQHRGQRAAQLKEQRQNLLEKRKQLRQKALQMNVVLTPMPDASDEKVQHAHREELENIVDTVQKNIGKEQARLKQMKIDFRANVRKDQADQNEIEASLGKLSQNPDSQKASTKFSNYATEIMSDWSLPDQTVSNDINIADTIKVPLEPLVEGLGKFIRQNDVPNESGGTDKVLNKAVREEGGHITFSPRGLVSQPSTSNQNSRSEYNHTSTKSKSATLADYPSSHGKPQNHLSPDKRAGDDTPIKSLGSLHKRVDNDFISSDNIGFAEVTGPAKYKVPPKDKIHSKYGQEPLYSGGGGGKFAFLI